MPIITSNAVTGNASAGGSWVGGVAPAAGDTAIIVSGAAITFDDTRTVGMDDITGTTAVTVNTGGAMYVTGWLNSQGNITQQRGATVEILGGGRVTLDASTGRNYMWTHVTSTGSTANFRMTGTSGNLATLDVGVRGGTGQLIIGDSDSKVYADAVFSFAKLKGLGGPWLAASNTPYQPDFRLIMSDCLILDCGQWVISAQGNAVTVDWDRVAIINPVDQNYNSALYIGGTVANVSGSRSINNVAVYSTRMMTSRVYCPGFTVNNFIGYNSDIDTNLVADTIIFNPLIINDTVGTNGATFAIVGANSSITDGVFLSHTDNPHYLVYSGGGVTLRGNLIDGENYQITDTGDIFYGGGSALGTGNIAINGAGVLVTAGGLTNIELYNNTTYKSQTAETYGSLVNAGESTTAPTMIVRAKNNLMVFEPAGIVQQPFFVSQSGFDLDFNASYNMTRINNLDYPAGHPLSGQNSYLGDSSVAAWWNPAQAFGTDNATHDIIANPQFNDPLWTVKRYFGAASVQAIAQEVMTITGFTYLGEKAMTPTTRTPAVVLAAGRFAFTPTNITLLTAGEAGTYIGAVAPVAPVSPVDTTPPQIGTTMELGCMNGTGTASGSFYLFMITNN